MLKSSDSLKNHALFTSILLLLAGEISFFMLMNLGSLFYSILIILVYVPCSLLMYLLGTKSGILFTGVMCF
jgi:hypothetical protein